MSVVLEELVVLGPLGPLVSTNINQELQIILASHIMCIID